MTLSEWLKKNKTSQSDFCKQIGTYRQALRRIHLGLGVSETLSDMVRKATNGEVFPKIGKKGRPRIYHELYD